MHGAVCLLVADSRVKPGYDGGGRHGDRGGVTTGGGMTTGVG